MSEGSGSGSEGEGEASGEAGGGWGPWERALASLLERPGSRLSQIGPGFATVEREGGLIVVSNPEAPPKIYDGAAFQRGIDRGGSLEILLIGGDAEPLIGLAARIDGYYQGWHQAEGAEAPAPILRPGGAIYEGPLFRHLREPADPPDPEAFKGTLRAHRRQLREASREGGFFRAMSRAPRATPILCGWLGAVWALQLWIGAPDWTPAMLRAGALAPAIPTVADEPWRMLSYANLHADWMHIGFNLFALYRVGGSIERLIGPTRLLALYVLAAAGGGIAAHLTGGGITVGASGAIWGLLGAEASLVLGRQGVLPDRIVEAARGGVIQNIMLNALISLHPQVSWAGHLGGGVVGFLLMQSGFLSAGLPRWAQHRGGPPPKPRLPMPILVLAAACALILPGSSLLAWATHPPLELLQPSLYVSRPLPSLGLRVDLPSGATIRDTTDGGAPVTAVGEVFLDPFEIRLRALPPGADPGCEGVASTTADGLRLCRIADEGSGGILQERALRDLSGISPAGGSLLVEVTALTGASSTDGTATNLADGVAATVALSARPLP